METPKRPTLTISPNWFSFILIFLCFTLTSGGWITWNYHLMDMVSPEISDILCMMAGYTLQAGGIALFVLVRSKIRLTPVFFTGILILYILFLIPSTLSTFSAAVIIFGLLDNVLCGILAALYFHFLAAEAAAVHRGVVFGGGYALSTIVLWLISLLGKSSFLKSSYILIIYIVIAALIAVMLHSRGIPDKNDLSPAKQKTRAVNNLQLHSYLLLGGLTILLLSIVKNAGFSFPTADIISGLNLELSRIFYGSGLLIAGIINDRSRKYGAICTLSALILPFISLALSGQAIPGMVFWSLDYFFYGFFSVFRVLLFADLAERSGDLRIAGLGLFAGRLGDALGTGLCMALTGHSVYLVIATSVLFVPTVILFLHLYLKLYSASEKGSISEQQRFEQFSASYGFSSREKEVTKLLLQEKSNSEIAGTLFVSESTVKFHIHNMLKKTGCKNRSELKALYSTYLQSS